MLTQDIYDFWRPLGHAYPMVDGHLSNQVYIDAAISFHIPYTKMGKKAL